jgi:hypothetical protein
MSLKHALIAALLSILATSGAVLAQNAAQPSIQPATPAFQSDGKAVPPNTPAFSPNDRDMTANPSGSVSELPSNPSPTPSFSPALGGSGPLDVPPVDSGTMNPPPTGTGAR